MIARSAGHLRQRGVALITALFVVALAVIAGVAMFEVSNLGVHRTANLALTESAWWYADGIESWVKEILLEDGKLNSTDSFADIWAQPVPYLPIDNGGLRGRVEDLQGRFNINNLAVTDATVAPLYLAQFQRLIDNLPDFKNTDSGNIGTAVRDWMSGGNQISGLSGANDGDYLGEQPPYRSAQQPMTNASELLLVKGMTKELYAALKPYVTALPLASLQTGTAINVNTASEPVLLSLANNIDKPKLEGFIATRTRQPLTDASQVASNPATAFLLPSTTPGSSNLPVGDLSTASNYFELQTEVSVGSGRVALYSVFYRAQGGVPVVIAHSTDTE